MAAAQVLSTYFLHVTDQGEEVRFDFEPIDCPTLRVCVLRGRDGRLTEQTWTKTLVIEERHVVKPRPRGNGWVEPKTQEQPF